MSRQSRWARRGAISGAIGVVVLAAGCGSRPAPGGDNASPPASQSAKASTRKVSKPKPPVPPAPTFDQATSDLIGALDMAAHARYVKSFGSLSVTPSQKGVILEMTDLADGRALVSATRAGHPHWSQVPVALVKVLYTEVQLQAAQKAVPGDYWKRYELVSVGYGGGGHLDVSSSDTSLKGPGGEVGRERLAGILTRTVGVRVVVTYSRPGQAMTG